MKDEKHTEMGELALQQSDVSVSLRDDVMERIWRNQDQLKEERTDKEVLEKLTDEELYDFREELLKKKFSNDR